MKSPIVDTWQKTEFELNRINLSGGVIFSTGLKAESSADKFKYGEIKGITQLVYEAENNKDPAVRQALRSDIESYVSRESAKGKSSRTMVYAMILLAGVVLGGYGIRSGIITSILENMGTVWKNALSASMYLAKNVLGLSPEFVNSAFGYLTEPFSWWKPLSNVETYEGQEQAKSNWRLAVQGLTFLGGVGLAGATGGWSAILPALYPSFVTSIAFGKVTEDTVGAYGKSVAANKNEPQSLGYKSALSGILIAGAFYNLIRKRGF